MTPTARIRQKVGALAAFALIVMTIVGVAAASSDEAAALAPGATGWVYASSPSQTIYTPPSTWSYNSESSMNRIERRGPGIYTVTFPNLYRDDFEAQVTAYGDGHDFCMLDGNLDNGTGVTATT